MTFEKKNNDKLQFKQWFFGRDIELFRVLEKLYRI